VWIIGSRIFQGKLLSEGVEMGWQVVENVLDDFAVKVVVVGFFGTQKMQFV